MEKRRRRTKGEPSGRRKGEPSENMRNLIETYQGLEWDERGHLNGGDEYVFVQVGHDPDVEPPATLPSIKHASSVYFMISADIALPDDWLKRASPLLVDGVAGTAFIPERAADWLDCNKIDDATIIEAIEKHCAAVREADQDRFEADQNREAKELLARERGPSAGLYASAARIDQETPMLIEGLMRERGVSVIYGAFNEFKTTLVLDMMAHVAMGARWQGRKVEGRPVVWYALEGKEEIPVPLRALEASLKGKETVWGDDRAPVTVLDRIPEDYREWRAEICRIAERWERVCRARSHMRDMPMRTEEYELSDGTKGTNEYQRYPQTFNGLEEGYPPVIVIDTLSLALGGEDEKGPKAVGFINDCLDLLKERPDFAAPQPEYRVVLEDGVQKWHSEETDATRKWKKQYPDETEYMEYPAASHVIIIHHQTKTGIEFAGHRAIAANTHGLYRVHRFGQMTDVEQPFAGRVTPMRVKGIPRPASFRFDVDVVPVEGTKQTAAILKDKATSIPKGIRPIIDALRELETPEAITPTDLNECIDVVAAGGAKDGSAKRKARQRYREKLDAAGVLEPVEDDNGKVAFFRFHDIA